MTYVFQSLGHKRKLALISRNIWLLKMWKIFEIFQCWRMIVAGSGRLGNGSSRSNGSIRSGSRTASRSGSRTGSRSNGISGGGGGGGGGGGKQRSSGIAMTSSSAHPYSMSPNPSSVDSIDHHQSTSSILNSSFGSIETTSSIMSSSSISSNPNALSPRKSSLKKPNSSRHSVPTSPLPGDPNGLGFANVGFAEPRTGSMKRVRIASQSTDVWIPFTWRGKLNRNKKTF